MGYVVFILAIFVSGTTAHAFLNTDNVFCTEKDVAKNVLRQTQPMTAYRHGDNFAFLAFQQQKDMALMFDRVGDFAAQKSINPRHDYDSEVEGYTLEPNDTVAFFEHARSKNIKLNSQERLLQKSLLDNGNMVLERGKFVLKKPMYLGAAHKTCGRGTAEHELNHLLFDSTPDYKNSVKKVFQALQPSERKMVRSVLNKLGYDNKTLSVEANLLGEFAAFFRDLGTLRATYAKEIAGVSPDTLTQISEALLALEKNQTLFTKCPEGVQLPTDDDETPIER